MMLLRRAAVRAWLPLLFLASSHASALTVTVSATDLPDPGADDLWSYRYELDGALATFESVRIAFDPTVHAPVGFEAIAAGWFAESDPGQMVPFPADGHVLFSPVSDGAGTPQAFLVTVARSVPGPVLAQSFEVLDAGFSTIGSGFTTTAAVPEPETWLLLLGGLAGVSLRQRSRVREGAPSA